MLIVLILYNIKYFKLFTKKLHLSFYISILQKLIQLKNMHTFIIFNLSSSVLHSQKKKKGTKATGAFLNSTLLYPIYP